MRPDRKKEKMASCNTVPPTVAHAGNGIVVSSSHMAMVSSSVTVRQGKLSYNACPPPPNLYGPSAPPPVGSPEKAKGGAASGNTSDGEKKGRRRPGRKSRQVADSSAFSLNSGSADVQTDGKSGVKTEETTARGQLSKDLQMFLSTSANLPSPSPSSMPNPSFKSKTVSDLPTSIPLVTKSTTKADTKSVDRTNTEQIVCKSSFQSEPCSSSSSRPSTGSGSFPLNPSCIIESGTGLKAKTKETLPIGIPKSKSKDTSKPSKCNAGPYPKRSGSLGAESKPLYQKGWRMCAPPGTSPISSGNFEVAGRSGSSCAQGEGEEAGTIIAPFRTSDGCSSQSPHSSPESSILGSPAIHVSGSPDKFVNGANTGIMNGHVISRSTQFSEHLSPEDAVRCIEAGSTFKGVLRVNAHYRSEAYVTLAGVPVDILIDGLYAQNRAMEGDIVAVQLNSASQWPRLKGTNTKLSASAGADDSTVKVAAHKENGAKGTGDTVLDGADSTMEFPPTAGWDSSLPASVGDAQNSFSSFEGSVSRPSGGDPIGTSLTSLFPSALEGEGKQSTHFKTEQFKVGGSDKGLARSGILDADRSMSEASLARLAMLVESMPGKRPTGRVVAILGKSLRREAVIGYLEVQGHSNGGRNSSSGSDTSPQKPGRKQSFRSGGMMTFVPVDNRFPKMVVFGSGIPDQLSKRLREADPTVVNELVVAHVEGWKVDSALPRASLKQSLGPGGTIETQTAAILLENAIHAAEFPESSLACLPDLPWKIPKQEVKKRKDLRGLRVFTIDPATAKDLDDALSVEQLDNGVLRIGVHIADVSYFVQADTALDKEAQNRSTSVYLIQRVLPMLPPLLCEELCSLNPGVDRLAFSVLWTMDPEGNVLDQWIGRTIICSCAKLTYGHAQEMIDEKILPTENGKGLEGFSNGTCFPILHGEHSWKDVIADVRKLHEVAKRRRESRFDGGALKLDNSKLVFTLDEDGEPYDSTMYQHQDSNFLVEEFMLLANMTVARVISSAYPDRALLRRHPEPNVRKLKEFEEFCSKNGFELDTSSSGALHLSLEKLRQNFQDDPVLFNILMLYATKPMQLAKYFCTGDLKGQEDDWAHYALAVPLYTHFTSPIRRYPDLVVHRTIAAALEAERALNRDGSLSVKKESQSETTGTQSVQCFSGAMINRDVRDTDAAQKALVVAAERHKIPELSQLSLMASHCNERRLASRNVKEASDKLYLWSMVKKKQGLLSSARVLALGPKFMSLYVCKIAMERRIYYDEIEGLSAEWFEATGTLVLNLSNEKVPQKKCSQARGRPQRTVADVALLVNPTDSISSTQEEETYEDLIREVEDRLAGKIIVDDDVCVAENKESGSDMVEPAVLPLTLRWSSSVPVSIHAIGGDNRSLDIAVRLYVSSYAT